MIKINNDKLREKVNAAVNAVHGFDWYDRTHEWTWEHFPNREHGEWHRVVTRAGDFPWDLTGPGEKPRKEPLHVQRMLIQTVELLRALEARQWRPFV